ncbi:MAG TPA: hypothetical protein VMU05_14675 [Dongiaceae bacterium]|nr:hypothetical protein [Dongiaceae bacterium]
MKQTVTIGIALLLTLTALPAGAQTQPSSTQQAPPASPSLGEYARQIRKEPDAKSKPKVFDNDNLPKDDKLSVVGKAAPEPETAAAETKPEEAASPSTDKQPKAGNNPPADTSKLDQAGKEAAWKQWADKIKTQQDAIDLAARELDVLQREYQVRAAAMYGDVGTRLRNSAEWDKQDQQYKQQIADKQKALDDAKQKLEDLQEEARKAGVPSSVREP